MQREVARLSREVAEVKGEQAEAKRRDAEHASTQLDLNRTQLKLNKWMVTFTGLLVVAAAISGGIAIWQGSLTRKTLNLTRDQFIASQRPWLGFRGPFKVDSFMVQESLGGAAKSVVDMSISYQLENFGNSPARKITIPSFKPAVTAEFEPPSDWQQKGCDFVEKMSGKSYFTQVLMPRNFTGPFPHRVIGGSLTEFNKIKFAWVIGCVGYNDTIGGIYHHTRIILWAPYSGKAPTEFYLYDSDAD